MAKVLFKLKASATLAWIWLTSIPKHAIRAWRHFSYFIPFIVYKNPCKPDHILLAIAEIIFYLFDLLGVTTALEIIGEWLIWSKRPLNDAELQLSKDFFADTINYGLVRVHSEARFTANNLAIAYVLFNTINHYRKISQDIFIHEMMHVWQFQHLGSVYTIKALYAQYKGNAYDYGGFENLYNGMVKSRELLSFNLEQQAEIIQDYCKHKQLNMINPLAESVYRYYLGQLEDYS